MKRFYDLEKLPLCGQGFDRELQSILLELNQKYGDILFDELIKRIEMTISNFQDEMGSIKSGLESFSNEIPRISEIVNSQHKISSVGSSLDDIPEWEYKLRNK